MTVVDDPSCSTAGLAGTAVPTDALVAGVGWLSSFDPSSASVAELDHARVVLGRVRSFADGLSVRVDAALVAATMSAGHSVLRARVVPEGPGSGTAAERKRRRDAATGAGRVSSFAGALARGEVSLDHVAALARVRNPAAIAGREAEVLAAATARSAEDFVRWLRVLDDTFDVDNGVDLDAPRRAKRALSFFDGEFGMGGLRVVLDPLAYASVRDAVFRMADDLWRHGDRTATPTQRYADAFVELILRGAGLSTRKPANRARRDNPNGDGEATAGDCDGGCGGTADSGPVGTAKRPRRPTMMVIINETTLHGRLETAGIATTVDGVPITATEARRLACDAELIPVVLGGDGRVLDIGRAGRYATDTQWTALLATDGGCVIAECTAPAQWCEAHHLHEWEHAGPTNLHNLCLLCAHHHRLLHTGGWKAHRDGAHIHIHHADGRTIPTRNRNGPTPPKTAPG